jgi:hypothetical protein
MNVTWFLACSNSGWLSEWKCDSWARKGERHVMEGKDGEEYFNSLSWLIHTCEVSDLVCCLGLIKIPNFTHIIHLVLITYN